MEGVQYSRVFEDYYFALRDSVNVLHPQAPQIWVVAFQGQKLYVSSPAKDSVPFQRHRLDMFPFQMISGPLCWLL
jgi:hypothetical protein